MTGRRWFWLGLLVGVPLMAIGMVGIFRDAGVTAPANFALWFVAGGVLHDALLAPAVLVIGWAMRRLVPGRALGPVQAAAALTGFVLVLALIPLLGWGRRAAEPTVQPLNYPLGVAVILAVIWAGAGLLIVARRRSAPRPPGRS